MNCIVGKSSVFEQSKPGGSTEAHTVKIVIPENDDILRCPAASDGENVSHSASCLLQLYSRRGVLIIPEN